MQSMQSIKNIVKLQQEEPLAAASLTKYTMKVKPSECSSYKNKYYEKFNCYITCKSMKSNNFILQIAMLWESGFEVKAKNESELIGSFSTTYDFKHPITFKRYPDLTQNFTFDVYNKSDPLKKKLLGRAKFLFNPSNKQKDFLLDLPIIEVETNKEIGVLQAVFSRCEKKSHDFIGLEIEGRNLKNVDYNAQGDLSDPFLIFHRIFNDQIHVPVHCTTALMDTLNPKWEKLILPILELVGTENSRIKIECWDWQEDYRYQFIGEVETSLHEILTKPVMTLKGRDKTSKTGELIVKYAAKLFRPSISDFITSEDKFAFVLGMDFSSYNRGSYNKKDLHKFDKYDYTPYLRAIEQVSKIMWGQDADGRIPCFGFGGRPTFPSFTTELPSSLIPLSGHQNKISILSSEKLKDSYKQALDHIEPAEHASITELLRLVRDWSIRDSKSGVYHVLVILTAGHLDDLQATIDVLVDIANLPISIILVGLGTADFSAMEKLDGDKKWLRNSKKKLAKRDIVHFLDFEEFYGEYNRFGKRLLEEFPDQFVSYKVMMGYKVDPTAQKPENLNELNSLLKSF